MQLERYAWEMVWLVWSGSRILFSVLRQFDVRGLS